MSGPLDNIGDRLVRKAAEIRQLTDTLTDCLNREWVAANPGYSYEWARGMWFCGCADCEAVR